MSLVDHQLPGLQIAHPGEREGAVSMVGNECMYMIK